MSITEILILCIITLNLLFAIWQTRILGIQIKLEAEKLDSNLANAIQVLLEQVPSLENVEQINPMQQLIMSMVQDRMKPPAILAKEVSRDETGKFSQDTTLSTE